MSRYSRYEKREILKWILCFQITNFVSERSFFSPKARNWFIRIIIIIVKQIKRDVVYYPAENENVHLPAKSNSHKFRIPIIWRNLVIFSSVPPILMRVYATYLHNYVKAMIIHRRGDLCWPPKSCDLML